MGNLGRFPNAELVCFVNMLVGKIEVITLLISSIFIKQSSMPDAIRDTRKQKAGETQLLFPKGEWLIKVS